MDAPESQHIDVWIVHLDGSEREIAQCRSWLSKDEQLRAARFHFDQHRDAFVQGRGVLRVLLSRRVDSRPDRVSFTYGVKGKPALSDPHCSLRFNVSNSGNLAAYAFTEGCELGIDIEHTRPLPDLEAMARRFFAPEEAGELMELAERERPAGFFRCWTRKEAYVKAVGDGFSVPLDSFRVTLRPEDAPRMVHLGGEIEAARNWCVHDFAPAPGYYGALMYRGEARPVEFHPLLSIQELLRH